MLGAQSTYALYLIVRKRCYVHAQFTKPFCIIFIGSRKKPATLVGAEEATVLLTTGISRD